MRMETLTMEEIFLVTYGCTFIAGIILGFVVYFIFEHDNRRDNHDGQSGA